MKKIVTIIVLVFAFTLTASAQKKGGKSSPEKMIKMMTKNLNLTEAQQSKIKPLLAEQMAERKAMSEKRKAMKDSGEKPSKEARKKMRTDRVAKEAAMNKKLAAILNPEQLAKYEDMAKKRKDKMKKKRQ